MDGKQIMFYFSFFSACPHKSRDVPGHHRVSEDWYNLLLFDQENAKIFSAYNFDHFFRTEHEKIVYAQGNY